MTVGKSFTATVTNGNEQMIGEIYPYQGDSILLMALESVFRGPLEAQAYYSFSEQYGKVKPRQECNCFIKIGEEVYLGAIEEDEYRTVNLIFSEQRDLIMGGLVCLRKRWQMGSVPKDLDAFRWYLDLLRDESTNSEYRYLVDQMKLIPVTPREMLAFEAINSLPVNTGLIKQELDCEFYWEWSCNEYQAVAGVSRMNLVYAADLGLYALNMNLGPLYKGTYVLVEVKPLE